MKDKFKNILKFILSNIIIKLFIIILIEIILLYTIIFLYSYFFESEKLKIDNYNFNQLEQVKEKFKSLNVVYERVSPILDDSFDKTNMYYESGGKQYIGFYNIGDFNRQYNAKIKPIKNCYYFNSENGKYPYIFGFKLETTFYKLLNFGKYYSYPGYDLNSNRKVVMGIVNPDPLNNKHLNNKTNELSRDEEFIKIVSNTCNDLDIYSKDK